MPYPQVRLSGAPLLCHFFQGQASAFEQSVGLGGAVVLVVVSSYCTLQRFRLLPQTTGNSMPVISCD